MGLRKQLLENPWIYDSFLNFVYRAGQRNKFVSDLISPKPGLRFLDVGCGTADVLRHLPEIEYLGIDSNDHYIKIARARYGDRGDFQIADVRNANFRSRGSFDRILLLGVLHHLSDTDCSELLAHLAPILKPNGYLVTLDPAFKDDQGLISRLVSSTDRGRFVRHHEQYRSLLETTFVVETAVIKDDFLRLPSCTSLFRLTPKH